MNGHVFWAFTYFSVLATQTINNNIFCVLELTLVLIVVTMRRNFWEGLSVSVLGLVIWLVSFLYKRATTTTSASADNSRSKNNNNNSGEGVDSFFHFLRSFANRGGLKHVFPGDDARDTSVQFELISQVNCTTSVGKPISVTVRNTPQDRRRMRMFGSFNDYQSY